MTAPDSDQQLRFVEAELGVTFPSDYREFILASGKIEENFGASWLRLWGLDELVPLNLGYDISLNHPGLIIIGTDGGGEAVGLDFRQQPPRVVLVNWLSAGWHEAIVPAETFAEFMDQRNAGANYNFDL